MDAEGYAVVSETLKTEMGRHLPKPVKLADMRDRSGSLRLMKLQPSSPVLK
jgi:hypothetical protein